MSDREGLLAAIAADPDDDTPRLVLADYLDERDDPLGEFIRLQMALEPLRIPRDDPAEELERHKRLAGIPPSADQRDEDWLVARQRRRERELLRAHEAEWLGKAASLEQDSPHTYFGPEFRRGFVASAGIGLRALLSDGDVVRRACPTLRELIVFGTLGRGEEMASCAALAGLPRLMTGWLDPEDAAALARSPHLAGLRSLCVWVGFEGGPDAMRELARLSGLRELRLVQMEGGTESFTASPEQLDRHADQTAALARELRPDWRVTLERPFARRFPLDGRHVGRGLNGGHLPDGQSVLVCEDVEPVIIYFDAEGRFVRETTIAVRDKLTRPPEFSWQTYNVEEMLEVLGREIGFRPGPIFVREFRSPLTDAAVACWWGHSDEMYARADDAARAEDADASVYSWWSSGQFILPFGNDYGIDGLGRVHSS